MPAKKDLLNDFPQDPKAKRAVIDSVKEIVDAQLRISGEKEHISSITDVCQDKYGVSSKFVNLQAKLLYDKTYKNGKGVQTLREQSEALELFEDTFSD